MELLVKHKQRKINIEKLPEKLNTIRDLLPYIRDNFMDPQEVMKGGESLFMSGDSVRPGILVLINDVDWSIEGELDYNIQNGDSIVFISTLHGG